MYGEKSEQAEELRLDLADVKEMYRQQVRETRGTCGVYACLFLLGLLTRSTLLSLQIQDLLLEKERSHTRSTKMNINS